jgi:hypothetical protein
MASQDAPAPDGQPVVSAAQDRQAQDSTGYSSHEQQAINAANEQAAQAGKVAWTAELLQKLQRRVPAVLSCTAGAVSISLGIRGSAQVQGSLMHPCRLPAPCRLIQKNTHNGMVYWADMATANADASSSPDFVPCVLCQCHAAHAVPAAGDRSHLCLVQRHCTGLADTDEAQDIPPGCQGVQP